MPDKSNISIQTDLQEKLSSLQKEKEKATADIKHELEQVKAAKQKEDSQLVGQTNQMRELKDKYESLKSKHDSEVHDLFENKFTLKFVKQMRHYKQEWAQKTAEDDRKRIATQMASATKNFVSAEDETLVKDGEESD